MTRSNRTHMQRSNKYMDLRKVCRDRRRSHQTTWADMKKNFSTEIQMNKTGPSVMRWQETANAALERATTIGWSPKRNRIGNSTNTKDPSTWRKTCTTNCKQHNKCRQRKHFRTNTSINWHHWISITREKCRQCLYNSKRAFQQAQHVQRLLKRKKEAG